MLTRQAADQLRDVLAGLGRRLASAPVRDPESLTTLVDALIALSEKLERLERQSAGRTQQLSETLGLLAQRLSDDAAQHAARMEREASRDAQFAARLDRIADQLDQVSERREPLPVRLVMAVSCIAAALSVASAALLASETRPVPPGEAPAALRLPPDLVLRPAIRLSVDPGVGARGPSITPTPREGGPVAPRDSYDAVAAALARGDAMALPRLSGLAEAGDRQAQMTLAGLYEAGRNGLPRDLYAARLWTRRAAEAGERVAMHNLALFLMQGEGGAQDFAEAAVWFRRAADRGVVDSQHNLGRLYEAGRGVERNLREAYRWFTVAANAGDGASREKAIELEARLNPNERSALEQAAATFQPGLGTSNETSLVVPPATTISETQALLARRGYYVGPIDGTASPAYLSAVNAYRRDTAGAGEAPQR